MPETVGRYEILERIGQGGMGAVYKAFDPVLRRTVAVKVISAVLDSKPDIRERFFREAQSAGQLSHKNIIVIYDLGEDAGRPFLAMEYLSGAALSTRMTGGGRLSARRAVDVMIQVCHALEYAHERGVVHRDITPANIFITDLDEVKILDFGLAHLVASELTRSETIMGTANYMSPEQVRGERVDRRTDIFATGVVLYELLSGRKAFEGDSFANTLFKVLESSPPSLQELDPRLPPKLVLVVERALAKRREDRYQTAAEMLHDLVTCRDWTDSVPAVPPTLAPTVAGAARPVTPPAPAAVTSSPTSVAWSPRRVRTTALVGGMLAIAAALLMFDGWQRDSGDGGSSERRADAIPQATPGREPAPPPVTPPVTAPPENPPPAVEAAKPARPVARPPDAPGTSQADRTRANDAIARARKTRALADAAGADDLPAYRRALSTEGEAAGLYAAGQFARAAARAVEAEAMYRGAEIEARAEQTARERLRAESARPPVTEAPFWVPRPEPPQPEPPRADPPAAAARTEPAVEAADPRDSIRAVLSQYVAALEARNIAALKTLWPSLAPSQERAIRSEFANARSVQVRLADPRIDVDGATATVSTMREYQIVTADGHRLATNTRMAMRMRRAGGAWVIEGITYQ